MSPNMETQNLYSTLTNLVLQYLLWVGLGLVDGLRYATDNETEFHEMCYCSSNLFSISPD